MKPLDITPRGIKEINSCGWDIVKNSQKYILMLEKPNGEYVYFTQNSIEINATLSNHDLDLIKYLKGLIKYYEQATRI